MPAIARVNHVFHGKPRNLRGCTGSRIARKTGVLACQDRQASGLSEQPGTG